MRDLHPMHPNSLSLRQVQLKMRCPKIRKWREMIPEVMAEHERVVRVAPQEEILEEGGVVGARLQRKR